MIETIALIIFMVFSFMLGALYQKSRSSWRQIEVPPQNRGPNADKYYYVAPSLPDGRIAWFTEEAVELACERAKKLDWSVKNI